MLTDISDSLRDPSVFIQFQSFSLEKTFCCYIFSELFWQIRWNPLYLKDNFIATFIGVRHTFIFILVRHFWKIILRLSYFLVPPFFQYLAYFIGLCLGIREKHEEDIHFLGHYQGSYPYDQVQGKGLKDEIPRKSWNKSKITLELWMSVEVLNIPINYKLMEIALIFIHKKRQPSKSWQYSSIS